MSWYFSKLKCSAFGLSSCGNQMSGMLCVSQTILRPPDWQEEVAMQNNLWRGEAARGDVPIRVPRKD